MGLRIHYHHGRKYGVSWNGRNVILKRHLSGERRERERESDQILRFSAPIRGRDQILLICRTLAYLQRDGLMGREEKPTWSGFSNLVINNASEKRNSQRDILLQSFCRLLISLMGEIVPSF